MLPVGVDKSIEGKSIPPAGGKVLHVNTIVAWCFPLTPDQQSLLGWAMSYAVPLRKRRREGSEMKWGKNLKDKKMERQK